MNVDPLQYPEGEEDMVVSFPGRVSIELQPMIIALRVCYKQRNNPFAKVAAEDLLRCVLVL